MHHSKNIPKRGWAILLEDKQNRRFVRMNEKNYICNKNLRTININPYAQSKSRLLICAQIIMKEEIKALLSDVLPMVDFDAEYLFEQLDSITVLTILTVLAKKYSITLGVEDATPKNLISLDALVRMVDEKIKQQ